MSIDVTQLQELEQTEIALNPAIGGCCYLTNPFAPPYTVASCFGCTLTS